MLNLDKQGPLYAQLYRAVRAQILAGKLPPGARMSATRALATELGLSRNVVMQAYEQLLAEGYLVARTGAGTFVASDLPQKFTTPRNTTGLTRAVKQMPVQLSAYVRRIERDATASEFTWAPRRTPLPYEFRYGRPSVVDFPPETWCRVLARRARRISIRDLDYGPPEGLPSLREAIADYLARARAVRCTPEQVVILNGSQQAFDLAARVLIDPGDRVVLEEPQYRAARAVMQAAGATIRTIPVDEQGLCTGQLTAKGKGSKLIVVTPSHQFPTGAVMPLARRLELLAWSERESAFIFEDDYDSEYRYSGRPIEALQALDSHGSVLYAGTFSKVMFPGLCLGYLVVPEHLVKPVRTVKALLDTGSPSLLQLALVDFIQAGFFERHLHRLRMRNAARRAALLDAVERYLGSRAEVSGVDAGLHVLLWLPEVAQCDEANFRKRAEELGVGVYSVTPFYSTPPPQAGLLLGYASLTEKEITEGIRRLASVLKTTTRSA
ncbi:MAG: PLP-dependent aminotransferase family protein [Deltaproteobacteria bacterium]|nr:PLP-dependent aminotransferase family protein [Deltaproteobacteria bacterium]